MLGVQHLQGVHHAIVSCDGKSRGRFVIWMGERVKEESGKLEVHEAQGVAEYAMLIVLLVLAVIGSLALSGVDLKDAFSLITGEEETEPAFLTIRNDFLARMEDYHEANERWPRSWGDYRFEDLGLDPADWEEPVEGIQWNPNGDRLGLANVPGDSYQIYVDDLAGNTVRLYDGWNIWCPVQDEHCYYHTVAPGNEVDMETLVVVEE